MATITYTDDRPMGRTYTDIPLGRDNSVQREPGDIILRRDIAVDLPIAVAIQLRVDGTWRWWYTEPATGLGNTYWHFSNASPGPSTCTDAQRHALDRMQRGEITIFGMRGALGNPVIQWAFGKRVAAFAAAYHD